MLNKYVLTVKGNRNDLIDLEVGLKNMYYNKVMHQQEFGHLYFFGMRKNWFPLIMLHKYTARHGQKSLEKRISCGVLFMAFLQDPALRSFYIDKYDVIKYDDYTLKIYYRAKNHQGSTICKILELYNLKLRFEINTIKK